VQIPNGVHSQHVEEVVGITNEFALANGSAGVPLILDSGGHKLLHEARVFNTVMFGRGISNDGQVVAGDMADIPAFEWRPFIWSKSSGHIKLHLDPPISRVTALSGDGRVVVGASGDFNIDSGNRAFRWTAIDGLTYLDSLYPQHEMVPMGVSYDGSAIVGSGWTDAGYRAFRWTADDGTKPLDVPIGFAASVATDVSQHGDIVVGQLAIRNDMRSGEFYGWHEQPVDYVSADPIATAQLSHAMIWDTIRGTRPLKDVLIDEYGLGQQIRGWSLVSASAMSANGNVIAGVGVNPAGDFQGWVVVLTPEPHAILLTAGWLPLLNRRGRARLRY
jgi:uncharacterized membrane protein